MSKKKKERAVIVTTEQEIGVAHCLHGHKWVSPPVVCPYCEIAKLVQAVRELQAENEKWRKAACIEPMVGYVACLMEEANE